MNIEKLRENWLTEEYEATIKGWDFSHIEGKVKENELPWNYKHIIQKYLKSTDKILDIDTGGGEFLLSLNHPYELTSVTEGYAPNIALCEQKLGRLGIEVRAMSNYARMPFENNEFDVIINRHGAYDAKEIYRILKPGGLFITQQVGEDNDWDLIKRLLPKAKKTYPGHNLQTQAKTFETQGFTLLEQDEAHPSIYFYDTKALIWFAKIIPWEFQGFTVQSAFQHLLDVEEQIKTQGFIKGTTHRFYLVARKL